MTGAKPSAIGAGSSKPDRTLYHRYELGSDSRRCVSLVHTHKADSVAPAFHNGRVKLNALN